ncbi:ADP-ribose diphosphatase [Martiniozyma asiatica (nom. inval.)]|nr:ADP-ribose diphosphatase [Martiniozyma asiatica]
MATNSNIAGKLLKPSTTKAKITNISSLDQGRFINLKKLEYISPDGSNRVWEMATRPTKPENSPVDAVIIIPVLKYSNGTKKIVLVRQFRPPTRGICVEFPAGLVDPGDSLETCALRELKEECGYVGEVQKVGGVAFGDPGLTDASCSMIWVTVDMEREENKNPQPNWMDGEVIEVVEVEINQLGSKIEQWRKEGYGIDSRVESVVIGLNLLNL